MADSKRFNKHPSLLDQVPTNGEESKVQSEWAEYKEKLSAQCARYNKKRDREDLIRLLPRIFWVEPEWAKVLIDDAIKYVRRDIDRDPKSLKRAKRKELIAIGIALKINSETGNRKSVEDILGNLEVLGVNGKPLSLEAKWKNYKEALQIIPQLRIRHPQIENMQPSDQGLGEEQPSK